ncbi:MAG: nitrate reductase molybdenum cofactor assembly chaperone [Arachnia sp.]
MQFLPSIGRREKSKRRGIPAPQWEPQVLRETWQLVSLLLDYPTAELIARLPRLLAVAQGLPEQIGGQLTELIGTLGGAELVELQRDYVETFDYTRRHALHLSYYEHGDTRKRGIALVQFKQAYRRAGLEVSDAELPDHLSVVLEFGATGDVDICWELLNRHRVGIELLARALNERGVVWHLAVDALRVSLPSLDADGERALTKLRIEGPPSEEVGLDAYSLDPRLNPEPEPALSMGETR